MAHQNVKKWEASGRVGPRPCDWCGHRLEHREIYVHKECTKCERRCAEEERRFYARLNYDGDVDMTLPRGYRLAIDFRDPPDVE